MLDVGLGDLDERVACQDIHSFYTEHHHDVSYFTRNLTTIQSHSFDLLVEKSLVLLYLYSGTS